MKTIMIVEDDEQLARALEDFLTNNGYLTVTAKNSDDFFQSITQDVKVILLDINLPGKLDGFGILREIRKIDSEARQTPVIVLTNEGDIENMDKAKEMGAQDYLIKSNSDLNTLLNVIKNMIGPGNSQ